MALDSTILNPSRIADLLRTHYGIDSTDAERLPLGSANCYRGWRKTIFSERISNEFSCG